VWIFGSRARGDHRPGSDLDVAVELDMTAASGSDESGGLATWMFESEVWEKQLSVRLPLKLDLRLYQDEKKTPKIHKGLCESKRLVYEKK
jgi:predicted nucleotidyltransferase